MGSGEIKSGVDAWMRAILLLGALFLAAGAAISVQPAQPALAAHHIAEITEVMSGFDGDPDVQYVEVTMRNIGQSVTTNTRLTAFDSTRTFIAVLELLGSNVTSGNNRTFLMGTTQFETAAGIQADFEIDTGILPASGMVCWGAPGISPPLDPGTWMANDPNQYVDCVAYGSAAGANPPGNTATVLPAGDCKHSLTRTVSATFNSPNPPNGTWADTNTSTQFTLAVPSPRNNANSDGTLVSTNDADNDGAIDCQETAAGSSSSDVDSDDEGCADGEELGVNKATGGFRSPTNFWDFFDVPTGMTLIRDKAISGTDFFGLLGRFGAEGDETADPLTTPPAAPAYHPAYDRGGSGGPFSWSLLPADGTIAGTDFFSMLGQFGDDCSAAP